MTADTSDSRLDKLSELEHPNRSSYEVVVTIALQSEFNFQNMLDLDFLFSWAESDVVAYGRMLEFGLLAVTLKLRMFPFF